MRIVLLISSLALAACTVGEVGTSNNGGGADGGGSGSGDPNACADRQMPADIAHTHNDSKTSNKGLNCLQSGCHLNNALGTGAPGYQFAGTVYAAGTTNPSAGALVRIKSGTTVLMTRTDVDGNFYFPAGSLPGNFMATTNVSACPTITPMVTQLIGGGGAGANSCNLCHAPAGTAGAQTTPISL